MERTLHIHSEAELPAAAESLLEFAADASIFCFFGEMGAGKTTFIKAICKALEVEDHPSSPTFSLVNEYRTQSGDLVYHFDFYRIEDEEEALDIGVEEYFYSGHRCLIEWPEKILYLLPESYVKVAITESGNHRILTFSRV